MKQEHKKYILENIGRKPALKIAQELGLRVKEVNKVLKRQRGEESAARAAPPRETGPAIKKKTLLVCMGLIIVLGIAVYANSLNGKFVLDDDYLIKNNAYIKQLSNASKIFTENIGQGAGVKSNFYRPVYMLANIVDHSIWKLDVRGYHLTNIILHVGVALLIVWLLYVINGEILIAWGAGALFVVHPIHTEAVSYISGRADPLSALFLLLAFIFYIKYTNLNKPFFYLIAFLSYAVSLLSKESGFFFPVFLILYHFVFNKKLKPAPFVLILAATFAYIAVRMTFFKALMPHIVVPTTALQRLPGFFVAIADYIKLLIAPFGLHMEYGIDLFTFLNIKAVLGMFIAVFLLIWAFRERDRNRLFFFAVLWFFTAILPNSNIYPINAYMAEHWLYLPSMGFFIILALGLRSLYRKSNFRIFAICGFAGLLVFYSLLTIRQNGYWKEPRVFYERTLKYSPRSTVALTTLGNVYRDMGRTSDAIALYKRSIEINPRYMEAYNNLGVVYSDKGMRKEAIEMLTRAAEIEPRFETYFNLSCMYDSMGEKEKVIGVLKRAIEIYPYYAISHSNIGAAYLAVGRKEEAIASFKKAIEVDPGYAMAYYNLGSVYLDMGKNKEAIDLLNKAVEIDPKYARAHNRLAAAYYGQMRYDLAIRHCDTALSLGYNVAPELQKSLGSYRHK